MLLINNCLRGYGAVQEINLYHLLKFYAKNWRTILLLTTFGVALGFVYNNYIQKPLYESNATLLLVYPSDKTATQDTTSINNYVELFKSRRVLEPVIAKQNMNTTYDDIVNSVSTTNQKDTQVIKVSIATKDPFTSTAFISGAVTSFKKQIKQLYGIDNVQVVDNASFNKISSNVHTEIQLALATVAGFIVSIIALFFVYDFQINNKGNLDTKEPKVKKIKVKKLSVVSRSLVAMISNQIKASSLKRQTAKLVRAKKAKLVKAKKAKKAELDKIKKNEKAELAKQKKANKLELSKVEKDKKVKQAKAKKAKKAKRTKANRALIKARLQDLKTKLTKVISDWLAIATKTIKSNLNKKSKVKAKPVKKAKSKKKDKKANIKKTMITAAKHRHGIDGKSRAYIKKGV